MNLNINNDPAMEKFMADLTAVDFNDLGGEEFEGHHVNKQRWRKYCQIVKAVRSIQDKDSKSVLKLHYLKEPDPAEEAATVMVVFPQAVALNAGTQIAFASAALLCDDIAMTAMDNKIRISYMVSAIWTD